jgi:hypothetical protein
VRRGGASAPACDQDRSGCPQPHLQPFFEAPRRTDEDLVKDVLALVLRRTGKDFSYYRRSTVLRRLAYRMQLAGAETLRGYLQLLRSGTEDAEDVAKTCSFQ